MCCAQTKPTNETRDACQPVHPQGVSVRVYHTRSFYQASPSEIHKQEDSASQRTENKLGGLPNFELQPPQCRSFSFRSRNNSACIYQKLYTETSCKSGKGMRNPTLAVHPQTNKGKIKVPCVCCFRSLELTFGLCATPEGVTDKCSFRSRTTEEVPYISTKTVL